MTQAKTIYDKIWDAHLVGDKDNYSLLYIDRHLIHEVTSPQAFAGLKRRNLNSVPWNPLRILVIYKFESTPLNTAKINFLKDKLLPNSVEYWPPTTS